MQSTEDNIKEIAVLKKHLQRYFSILNQCLKMMLEVETSAQQCIKCVVNLTEQYQCCCAISERNLPLQVDFSDVKQRLLFKISTDINEELCKLLKDIGKLEDHSDRLGRQYEQCMSQSKICCKDGHLDVMMQRSPLYPALTDMLEMAETSERRVREQYLRKKYLVDTFSLDHTDVSSMWEKSWRSGDSELTKLLQEYLALTSHFMELKT